MDTKDHGSPPSSFMPTCHSDRRFFFVDGVSEQLEPLKAPAEGVLAATSRGREHPHKSLKTWWSHLSPFNMIILIYLFLVVILLLSSGYIGLRIVQLEEQLTSMGAWPELDLQQQYKAS